MVTIIKENVSRWSGYSSPIGMNVISRDGKAFGVELNADVLILDRRIDGKQHNLSDILEFAAGCFKEGSNFFEILEKNKECNFVLPRKILVCYNCQRLLVTSDNANYNTLLEQWEKGEEVPGKPYHYLIGVRKLRKKPEYDGFCLIREISEERAIQKCKEGYDSCECECIGFYNKKDNTFLLKNASMYIPFKDLYTIEW